MTRTLSERDSKVLLASFGVPFVEELQARDAAEAVAAATEIGFPVVVKLGGEGIAHKTERGLVRLGLASPDSVRQAATELLAAARPEDGPVHLLVARMVSGRRELIAGLHRDPTFGMTVMLGLGGILAEATSEPVFRLVPLSRRDAAEMIGDLGAQRLLGAVRGEPPADREALAAVLLALSDAAQGDQRILAADLNPVLLEGSIPMAVDALVELTEEPV